MNKEKQEEVGMATDLEIIKEVKKRFDNFYMLKDVARIFLDSGKIMMSENAGIIYALDEDGKKAVEQTKPYGEPYHVIKTFTSEGYIYSVLYVSKYKEDWNGELNPGIVSAFVYNPRYEKISMMEYIHVVTANGGIMRKIKKG